MAAMRLDVVFNGSPLRIEKSIGNKTIPSFVDGKAHENLVNVSPIFLEIDLSLARDSIDNY